MGDWFEITRAWVFSCKFAAYFITPFLNGYFWNGLLLEYLQDQVKHLWRNFLTIFAKSCITDVWQILNTPLSFSGFWELIYSAYPIAICSNVCKAGFFVINVEIFNLTHQKLQITTFVLLVTRSNDFFSVKLILLSFSKTFLVITYILCKIIY